MTEIKNAKKYSMVCPPFRASIGDGNIGILAYVMEINHLNIFNSIVMITYNHKLSEAAQQANQANEAKSYFLSTMSHDISMIW